MKMQNDVASLQKIISDLEWYFADETTNIGVLQEQLAAITKRQDGTGIRAAIRNCDGHKKLIGKALGSLALVGMSRGETLVNLSTVDTDSGEVTTPKIAAYVRKLQPSLVN